jgi:hypothetical protein
MVPSDRGRKIQEELSADGIYLVTTTLLVARNMSETAAEDRVIAHGERTGRLCRDKGDGIGS